MEADLGLSVLTQTDKQVLASVVLITEDGRRDALLEDIRTHSLMGVNSVVASPLRNVENEVIGIIYGDREI